MRASPVAVNAARGAEHAPAERRAGASHVAENAAAKGGGHERGCRTSHAGGHVCYGPHQRVSVARSLHGGRGSRHRLDGLASPGAAGLEHL